MISTCDGFKACWLKNKMLLSPIFGYDTLNFTKNKFTGHELGVCWKKHSKTNSLLSASGRLLMKQRKYASLYYILVFI